MNRHELRSSMEQFWADVDRQGNELKDTFYAVERLQGAYSELSAEAREEADRLLAEWILGDDQRRGYDARVMISNNRIVSALPALRQLERRDARSSDPERRAASAAATRIIEKLAPSNAKGQAPPQ